MKPPLPRLHAITDERIARRADLGAVARQLGAAGGDQLAFHARGRALSGLEHYELSVRLSACPPVRLFVNDRLDIALAAGADGVQLRRDSLGPGDARRLNPAWERTLGFTLEELQSRPFIDFVHPDDRAATLAEVQRLAAGGETVRFENRYLTYRELVLQFEKASGHKVTTTFTTRFSLSTVIRTDRSPARSRPGSRGRAASPMGRSRCVLPPKPTLLRPLDARCSRSIVRCPDRRALRVEAP